MNLKVGSLKSLSFEGKKDIINQQLYIFKNEVVLI